MLSFSFLTMNQLLSIRDVYRASKFLDNRANQDLLTIEFLKGRLTEISSPEDHAAISLAMKLVASCHHNQEPAAWIGNTQSLFYPPDAASWGIDFSALALIQIQDSLGAGRAADKLLRSGAFGLVVVDLFKRPFLPTPLLGRLLRLAETHQSALLFLTTTTESHQSLSSLISLRIKARWRQAHPDRLQGEFKVLKDKRRGPGRQIREHFYGPMGLR